MGSGSEGPLRRSGRAAGPQVGRGPEGKHRASKERTPKDLRSTQSESRSGALQHLRAARSAPHPFDVEEACNDAQLRAVFSALTEGPGARKATRRKKLLRWRLLAAKQKEAEDALHGNLDVRNLLRHFCYWRGLGRGGRHFLGFKFSRLRNRS